MDTSEFESFYRTHAQAVYAYVVRRHHGDDHEDLVADVFSIAWSKRSEIPTGFELAWLYRTAWNVLSNNHRKTRDVLVNLAEESELHPTVVDLADHVALENSVQKTLRTLSDRDQEILRLAIWEDLSGKDLAIALGISVGGAGAALTRARTAFAAAWVN